MKRASHVGVDSGEGRVAAYESILDLFTLISFMLILAAAVQVTRSSEGQNWSSVVSEIARTGGTIPQALPRDVVLMVLYRENLSHRLSVVFGGAERGQNEEVTKGNIEDVLARMTSALSAGTKINIGLDETGLAIDSEIWVKMQRWLTRKGHGKFNVYYVEN